MTMSDAVLIAQLTPTQVVALTLYGEARGASDALRIGIAGAIRNRVLAQRPRWGLTAADVCRKPAQFSCWSPAGGAPNYHAVMEAAQLLVAGGQPKHAPLKACLVLGAEVVTSVLADTVHGATHYYSPGGMVPRDRVPAWAIGLEPVAVIDGTRFFAGVR
jgi:N-acetylmuramoyl-L-alanine amidase